ncbi:MAG: hypothetical protein CSA95_07230 [Bacteroidetes bacterium]|nr:MAG: hypothetical protein CSA95_07230 [Bacteroidota bacterium]
MNKKRYYIWALWLVGLFASSPTIAQKSDAIINRLEKHYTLFPDGRMQYREVKNLTLKTHYAFHRSYGESFILFNPEAQTLSIDKAYTLMADGKKVETPKNAFNAVLPRTCSNFPRAAHLREMVVTHTGLEVGATIHLDYVIDTRAGFFPALMGNLTLPQEDPVKEMKVVVRLPEGTPLNYHITKLRTAPEIMQEDGFTVYTFTFPNLAPRSHDQWQPTEGEEYPTLTFSSSKDLHRLIDRYVNQEAFQLKCSPAMLQAATEKTKEATTEKEKISAIQSLVANEIRHFNIAEKHLGYQLRTPEQVWQSNGGTKAENALLLTTLLRAVDLRATPVALFAPGTPHKRAGNLNEIINYLVEVKTKDGQTSYLATNREHHTDASEEYPGYHTLTLDAAIESLRFTTLPRTSLKRELQLTLHFTPEELTTQGTLFLSGKHGPSFKENDTTEYLDKLKELSIKPADVTQLEKIEPKGVKVTFRTSGEHPEEGRNGYYLLSLPHLDSDPIDLQPSTLQESRTSDIDLGNPLLISYSFEVNIPEGYRFVIPQTDIRAKNSFGSVEIKYRQREQRLNISKRFMVPSPTAKKEHWKEVKTLFDLWRTGTHHQLFIKEERM